MCVSPQCIGSASIIIPQIIAGKESEPILRHARILSLRNMSGSGYNQQVPFGDEGWVTVPEVRSSIPGHVVRKVKGRGILSDSAGRVRGVVCPSGETPTG